MPRRRVKVFQSSHKLFDPFFSFVNDERIAVCCRRGRGQQRGDGFDFGYLDGLAGDCVFDALRRANNTVGVRNMKKWCNIICGVDGRLLSCLLAFVSEPGAERR
jgi:hypothetical protein